MFQKKVALPPTTGGTKRSQLDKPTRGSPKELENANFFFEPFPKTICFCPFVASPVTCFTSCLHIEIESGGIHIQFETYISEYEILRKINWIGKQLLASNIVLSQVNLH